MLRVRGYKVGEAGELVVDTVNYGWQIYIQHFTHAAEHLHIGHVGANLASNAQYLYIKYPLP